MSLFLKIFLWFWLAMALIIGAITLVNWSTRTAPLARQFATFVGEAVTANSQTAAQIYQNEGLEGLEDFFERKQNQQRINSVGFFSKDKNLIAGNLKVADIDELFDQALESEEPQFKRFKEKFYVAKKITLDDNEKFIYVVELKRFQPPPFFTFRRVLQFLAILLIGGLFCFFLARYITKPIKKLSDATSNISDGYFQTRVAERIGNRRDELGDLASDFDEMAERIENLIDSERRLTQDISHELRSPLARMNVALELIRSKSNPDAEKLISRLETESERLNELIGQLLTLSKLEAGSSDFDKYEINLSKLLENIVSDANFEAKADKKIVNIVENKEAKVFGNEQLLRSAIENVLRNAVRYSPENMSVEVSLVDNEANSKITIRDFGEGVPEKELEKLFKPFYRVQEARDRKSGGTGLGLAIAERAVDNHDGTITARNTEKGLEVEIILPRID